MADDRIGRLFPAGGPVPPDLVIGRTGDIDEIARRVTEGIHTMLTGDRRTGKTTVCDATCERLRRDGTVIVEVEVPERTDSTDFLQLVIDRSSRISLAEGGRKLFGLARPLIEKLLEEEGIPLDLSQFAGERSGLPTKAILSLPLRLAKESGKPVVFYLDELQRAVDYADGEQVLGDLVDAYSGGTDVIVLVDGSKERALEEMLGPPIQFGKLCDRLRLDPRISTGIWREALPGRFQQAGLELQPDALDAILAFGQEHPYPTMTAARYSALNARKLGSETVGRFEAEEGVAEAKRHLEEDA